MDRPRPGISQHFRPSNPRNPVTPGLIQAGGFSVGASGISEGKRQSHQSNPPTRIPEDPPLINPRQTSCIPEPNEKIPLRAGLNCFLSASVAMRLVLRSIFLDLEDRLRAQHEAAVTAQVEALEVDLIGEPLHVNHGEVGFFRLIAPDREQGPV